MKARPDPKHYTVCLTWLYPTWISYNPRERVRLKKKKENGSDWVDEDYGPTLKYPDYWARLIVHSDSERSHFLLFVGYRCPELGEGAVTAGSNLGGLGWIRSLGLMGCPPWPIISNCVMFGHIKNKIHVAERSHSSLKKWKKKFNFYKIQTPSSYFHDHALLLTSKNKNKNGDLCWRIFTSLEFTIDLSYWRCPTHFPDDLPTLKELSWTRVKCLEDSQHYGPPQWQEEGCLLGMCCEIIFEI